MPRRPLPDGTLCRGYVHRPTGFPAHLAHAWGLRDAVTETDRQPLHELGPTPGPNYVTVVTWRVPFDVDGVDLRHFDDFLSDVEPREPPAAATAASLEGEVLLAVELLGPAGGCPARYDEAVRDVLDRRAVLVERLWISAVGHRFPERGAGRGDGPAAGVETCLLVRPDGVLALNAGLSEPERSWLEQLSSRPFLSADDLRASGARPRVTSPELSRTLRRLWARGALHPAAPADRESLPGRRRGDRRPLRLYRSPAFAADIAAYGRARRWPGRSEFSLRQYRQIEAGGLERVEANLAERARALRQRLRNAGAVTA